MIHQTGFVIRAVPRRPRPRRWRASTGRTLGGGPRRRKRHNCDAPLRRSTQTHETETKTKATTTTTMTSYKKTIATMVVASMLVASVAYAEEAQAEEQASRSLQQFFGAVPYPGLLNAGQKIGRFGRWETRAGRNAWGNGHPALGLAGIASGMGNRGAGKILRRAGRGNFPFGRKLQEAEGAPEFEGRSLQQFGGFGGQAPIWRRPPPPGGIIGGIRNWFRRPHHPIHCRPGFHC